MPDPRLDADERDWTDAKDTIAELQQKGCYSTDADTFAQNVWGRAAEWTLFRTEWRSDDD